MQAADTAVQRMVQNVMSPVRRNQELTAREIEKLNMDKTIAHPLRLRKICFMLLEFNRYRGQDRTADLMG